MKRGMAMPRFLQLLHLMFVARLASPTIPLNDVVVGPQLLPAGRTLLQHKADCNIDFENQNYTIITSQCKGPNYQPKACCDALKEFACPFYEELNDLKNDCAIIMFNYINVYGKYPPGLFSNYCQGDKLGISCEQVLQVKDQQQSSEAAAVNRSTQALMLILTLFFLNVLFNL